MKLQKYTDGLAKKGAYEPSISYLMDAFLQSRIATKNESNRDYFDEDVNVYLALLLNSVVTDRFHKTASRYIARYNTDLTEVLDRAENPFMRYEIYRMNGDNLLLRTGLFRLPKEGDPSAELLDLIERGSAYYRFACSFTEHIPERYRPLSEVLAKLAYDFDKYRRILQHMRGEFLGLVEPITNHDISLLYADMEVLDKKKKIQEAQDTLLDAYLTFQRAGTAEARAEVERSLANLQKLDPGCWPDLELETISGASA
ncbi:MAG: hypothetical protein JW958_07510 [Candidatus Eisenbacteria bacterium]|nr:hypothetical protein [Candidatus Eisenbacteria bacterium]